MGMDFLLADDARNLKLFFAMAIIGIAIVALSPKPSGSTASNQQAISSGSGNGNSDLLKPVRNALEDASKPKAPELAGISGWINSEPLTLEGRRGNVVLIDFWTYTCINCQRTLPYLREWHQRYAKDGLVIIGVHTPEFEFEKEPENVRKAVEDAGVEYAVAMDNDYATWRAYNNNFWPRKYLIDVYGRIRYDHIGEGAYEETEMMIQKLLLERIEGLKFEELAAEGVEAETASGLPQTPETYAGYGFARVQLGNAEGYLPDKIADYSVPATIPENAIVLEGKWESNYGNLRHADNSEGKLINKFTARKVYLVAEGRSEAEIRLDGKYLTARERGEDVAILGDGRSIAKFAEPRMYRLIGGETEYGTHLLEITVKDEKFSFYAFTYG